MRRTSHCQPFSQPAALVQLDVHDIESANERGNIRKPLDALIRGDWDGGLPAIEQCLPADRKGCSMRATRASINTGISRSSEARVRP